MTRHILEALAQNADAAIRHLVDNEISMLLVQIGMQWVSGGGS